VPGTEVELFPRCSRHTLTEEVKRLGKRNASVINRMKPGGKKLSGKRPTLKNTLLGRREAEIQTQ